MSPQAAAAPYQALAGVGQQIERSALYAGHVFGAIERARRTVKSNAIGNSLDDDFADAAQGFKLRTDFENFESDADKISTQIRQKYSQMTGDDPVLMEAVNTAIEAKERDFKRVIRDKEITTLVEVGKGEFHKTYLRAVDDAAGYEDPEKVAFERTKILNTAKAYVESGILTNKEAVEYVDKFDDAVKKVATDKDEVAADQLTEKDPSGTALKLEDPNFLPNLSIKTRQAKKEAAQKEAVRRNEKAESDIEKQQKEIMNQNDSNAISDFYDKKLTWNDLKARRQSPFVTERISEATFDKLAALINKPETEVENNPSVVGDLAERIGRGENVGAALTNALNSGQIKTETYISMKKALGNEQAAMAVRIINQALQPSQLDRWSPDKNLRHAEATRGLVEKIASGKDPILAADEIVNEFTGHIARTRAGLPTPIYLEGNKDDSAALEKAQSVTVTSYELGVIDDREYKRQIQIIDDLKKMISESARSMEASKELEKLSKQVKN